ncbi:RNA ligase family protein [Streptomyces sp. Tu6071]|uniref:RNA ligase family protein n=1 Tax=Streptomyces sp. Tu6071 TaxID=355249 RepID=UPI0007C6F87C
MHAFTPWPKTARLFRNVIITEKIDGTNSAVHISELPSSELTPVEGVYVSHEGKSYWLNAQSRKRMITPEADNFGFARWAYDNAEDLVRILGAGLHYGEWWGRGIQRGYGLNERRFSLFNVSRWYETGPDGLDSMSTRAELSSLAGQIGAVPVLYTGMLSTPVVRYELSKLRHTGSKVAPGYMSPEGVCIYHTQSRSIFKATLDHDDAGKWETSSLISD